MDRIPDAASDEKRRDSTVGCFFLYLAREGADRGFIVASFIAAIAFLGFLSLQFDFGSCINPSRERPYFFQGRLMTGATIPFALLYVYGLHRLLRAVPALVLPALVAIATAITIPGFSPTVSPLPAFTIGFTCNASDRHFRT